MPTVCIRINSQRRWGWQRELAAHLATDATVRVSVAMGSPLPPPVRRMLAIERRHPAFEPWQDTDGCIGNLGEMQDGSTEPPADIIIDLAAERVAAAGAARTLVPLYDGAPGEDAMWASVMSGRAPRLAAHDSAGGVIDIGQPAIESPHALQLSAGAVMIRLIAWFGQAVSGRIDLADRRYEQDRRQIGGMPSAADLRSSAAALLARKAIAKTRRMSWRAAGGEPQWAVLYARGATRERWPTGDFDGDRVLDPSVWQLLPDDGRRYYADPFLYAHDGRVFLFVEELPYASARGIISVTELPGDGRRPATPRPVLDTGHHLSYPQVFARDGEIWMLPEQNKSGALVLYRAKRFPDVWEPAATLVAEPLHDATLFEHGDRLWIAATHEGPQFGGRGADAGFRWGSSWDALSLYSATSLFGPWRRHIGTPVLIDAATARPAGPVLPVPGTGGLVRPVQDCGRGYGEALSFATIDRLDDGAFRQTVVGRMRFPAGSGLTGPHTLSRCDAPDGRIEAIDAFGARRAFASQVPGSR